MAKCIVTKRKSELNLTSQQSALFQNIILVGNQMSDLLRQLDKQALLPEPARKLPMKWGNLMVRLLDFLI